MRKVIGIGETILDIIFRNDQPSAAVPGGSVFNGIVSLGRMGVNVCFISETGNDHVGNIILQFMRDNHIPTDHVNVFPDGKSPVSLAFLNEHSDAEYIFYKDYPKQRLDVLFPSINEDDIIVIGSYYALNPVLRDKILELLDIAKEKRAIVYYDHYREPGICRHCKRFFGRLLLYVRNQRRRKNLQGQDKVLLSALPLHSRSRKNLTAYERNIQRVSCRAIRGSQHYRCRRQF